MSEISSTEKEKLNKLIEKHFQNNTSNFTETVKQNLNLYITRFWEDSLTELRVKNRKTETKHKIYVIENAFNTLLKNFDNKLGKVSVKLATFICQDNQILVNQFVSYKFNNKTCYGKVKNVLTCKLLDILTTPYTDENYQKLFSYEQRSFMPKLYPRGNVYEFYNSGNFSIYEDRVEVVPIVDNLGNMSKTPVQVRPAKDVQIACIDEILSSLTVMLLKM